MTPTAEIAEPVADQLSVAARLERWRATLPAEVIAFGISLGMTRREVLATAVRFVKWYTAHPERAPADFTAAFCGYTWLERDAARKAKAAAKRAKAASKANPPQDDPADDFDPDDPDGDCARYDAYLARRAAPPQDPDDDLSGYDADEMPAENWPADFPDPFDDDEEAGATASLGGVAMTSKRRGRILRRMHKAQARLTRETR